MLWGFAHVNGAMSKMKVEHQPALLVLIITWRFMVKKNRILYSSLKSGSKSTEGLQSWSVCVGARAWVYVCGGEMRCGIEPELELRSFLIDFIGRGAGVGHMQNMGGLIINDRICR